MMQSIRKIFQSQGAAPPALAAQLVASQAVEYCNGVLRALFPGAVPDFCEAKYLRHGVMHIACQAPAVAQEILLHKEKIIEKLQARFPKAISDIHCIPAIREPEGLSNAN